MQVARWILLLLVALVPLATLIHTDDRGRWDRNRSLMVAPDEFSYMLGADALLHGGHISTQKTIGIDTFYPPGFSLMLSGWGLLFGVTAFAAHVFNALLISAATLMVYAFSRTLLGRLGETDHRRRAWSAEARAWIALLIAGIFATNWHVLEGTLFVLSEPVFTLATFAWIGLTLLWPEWHLHPKKTAVVALLAVAAWSIRGAGLACVAVTFLYPTIALLHQLITKRGPSSIPARLAPIALILLITAAYQAGIALASPNKSLAGADDAAAHGYMRQLLDGVTLRGQLHPAAPRDWPKIAGHMGTTAWTNLGAYCGVFLPEFREPPDYQLREALSWFFGALSLAAFICHLLRRPPATHMIDAYLFAYFALYLIWPFPMTRFWTPILPIMLVYIAELVRHYWDRVDPEMTGQRPALKGSHRWGGAKAWRSAAAGTAVLLALLLALNLRELSLQLQFFQCRINLVSDVLAKSAEIVERQSPDPDRTILAVAGADEHFVFSWYLPRVPGGTALRPRSPENGEHVEQLLLRCLDELDQSPDRRLFVISYFTDVNYDEVAKNLEKLAPDRMRHFQWVKLYQFARGKENVTNAWEIRRK